MDCGTSAGLDPADLPGKRSGDSVRLYITGPHQHAVISTTAIVTGKTGAIHKGAIVSEVAGRIPGTKREVLGTTFVGMGPIFARRWVR
jgi:hypothetical protein